MYKYIGCPTTYQTRQFFNNSKTNEDIAMRFEQEYVRCVRNEKECVCSKIMSVCVCSKIIKVLPGLVGSGTQPQQAFVHHTLQTSEIRHFAHCRRQWLSYDSYSIKNAVDFFISHLSGEPNYLVR